MKRYETAGGQFYVCPICFDAKKLDKADLIPGAELQGTVPMWSWIGDEGATTFSF
jgi:intracellular sulfur oxidation DsrE/DsrF family protein